jgi:hypothetical protein
MASGSRTVVEHLPRHLKVKGSSLATAADTGRVNMFANVTAECCDTKMEQLNAVTLKWNITY